MYNKKALLIINPGSRQGSIDPCDAINYLKSKDILTTLCTPQHASDISTLIVKYADSNDFVIVGGGDGTLNCATKGIIEKNLPIGIMPLGTANDLARTLGIPMNPFAALDIIIRGKLRTIDIGCVNDVYFFNASSIGLGVDVTRKLSKESKSKWGILSYAHAVWHTFNSHRPFKANIVYDGMNRKIRTIQITIGNGRFYGGGMVIEENAEIDDNLLDLYSLEPQGFWKLLTLAPVLRMGSFKRRRDTEYIQANEISIFTRKPRPVTTDGEISTNTPAHYRVISNAICVFTP